MRKILETIFWGVLLGCGIGLFTFIALYILQVRLLHFP